MNTNSTSNTLPKAIQSFKESPLLDNIINFAFTGHTEFIFRIYEELLFKASPEEINSQLEEVHKKDPNFIIRYNQLKKDRSLAKDFDLQALIKFPTNTFGHYFAKYMIDNSLENNFASRFDFETEWSFYVFLTMQTHDAWHILTGCHTDYLGEVGLTGFYLGQHASTPILATLIADFINPIVTKDLYKLDQAMMAFTSGYKAGKEAKPIFGLNWEAAFHQDLDSLREDLNIKANFVKPKPGITF